jgi:hypothetical protein
MVSYQWQFQGGTQTDISIPTVQASPGCSIESDNVVAWLVTQPNANGMLYLENVARSYMGTLRNAPPRLDLPAYVNRNVFECGSLSAFDSLVESFKTAPNFPELNRTMGRGQFSAALSVFRRYLEHLESEDKGELSGNEFEPDLPQPTSEVTEILDRFPIEENDNNAIQNESKRVDFHYPELCAQTWPSIFSAIENALSEKFPNGIAYSSPFS